MTMEVEHGQRPPLEVAGEEVGDLVARLELSQ